MVLFVAGLFLFYCLFLTIIKQTNSKTNSSDTEAPFLGMDLSITNGIVLSKIYDNSVILILK